MLTDERIPMGISDWNFGKPVSTEFDSHVLKSIPLYETFEDLTAKMCDWYIKNDSKVIDLGCSTAKFAKTLYKRHWDKNISYIGVDLSSDMIEEAKSYSGELVGWNRKFVTDSIENYLSTVDDESVDIVVSLFTLQFIPDLHKRKVLEGIFRILKPEGIFLYADKFAPDQYNTTTMFGELYDEFKMEQGLTEENVIAKKTSLRGVQHLWFSEDATRTIMEVGFDNPIQYLSYLNFSAYLFVK